MTLIAKIDHRIDGRIGFEINTAAISAISTVRPTSRNILFPAKAQATVATTTSLHLDGSFIDKFHAENLQRVSINKRQGVQKQKSPVNRRGFLKSFKRRARPSGY
jgi:hypothetical protein